MWTFLGQVAQLVEQRIENPRVGGSIPPLGTIKIKKPVSQDWLFYFMPKGSILEYELHPCSSPFGPAEAVPVCSWQTLIQLPLLKSPGLKMLWLNVAKTC